MKTNYENYNKLTPRETEITYLFCDIGLTKKQISYKLKIGLSTVISHLKAVYNKKEIHTSQELMHWYWKTKWDKAFTFSR